jgi:hypothetical protein
LQKDKNCLCDRQKMAKTPRNGIIGSCVKKLLAAGMKLIARIFH